MLKVEAFKTYGWESAIRGMRNPMNSWEKSDSKFDRDPDYGCYGCCPCPAFGVDDCTECFIGHNDLDLMKRLRNGGSDDRKYLRQIFVSCDITAPLYWWKEMDQYKVGTTTNSCSTMHKIAEKEFTLEDFSTEHLISCSMSLMRETIDTLNEFREWYLKYDSMQDKDKVHFAKGITCKKDIWWQMIQLLPSSYNQKRTWTADYEVLVNIYHARNNHKLDEWRDFCREIEKQPYAKELIISE